MVSTITEIVEYQWLETVSLASSIIYMRALIGVYSVFVVSMSLWHTMVTTEMPFAVSSIVILVWKACSIYLYTLKLLRPTSTLSPWI